LVDRTAAVNRLAMLLLRRRADTVESATKALKFSNLDSGGLSRWRGHGMSRHAVDAALRPARSTRADRRLGGESGRTRTDAFWQLEQRADAGAPVRHRA